MGSRELEIEAINDIWHLARVVWLEARGEPDEAKLGVAFVVLNRVHNPAWWGETIPEVVWKKWQFSSMTDPNDAQRGKMPTPDKREDWLSWLHCLRIAFNAYASDTLNPVPGADHYFDDSISPPSWAAPEKFVRKVGHLNFFDLGADPNGDWCPMRIPWPSEQTP